MSFVYILTNEAMPGIIKIGLTERPVKERVFELDSTSIPLPFQCYYAAKVEDHRKVEKALHTAFGDSRVRPNREFFKLDPYKVKAVLELLAIEDVTPKEELVESKEDLNALHTTSIRAGKFKFTSAGIPINSILQFAKDSNITCTVIDDSFVSYENEIHNLTSAALLALAKLGYEWTSVQGPQYWIFDGETVGNRRERMMDS